MIDHKESPGITPEQARGRGPAVGKGQKLETPTYTCVHCQAVVVINPLRTRARGYCQKCDDYQCDACVPFECKPFQKVIDEIQEAGAKGIVLPPFVRGGGLV